MRAFMTYAGLVLLCAPAGAQTYHNNVVILLDGSGSMGGELRSMGVSKIDAAKNALSEVLLQVPDSTYVGLLVFSRRHRDDPWLYPLGPRNDEKLREAISRVREGGGTPLGVFMKRGADRLLEERAKQFGYGSYRLLVVTDGEAGDQRLVERYTPEILARGITIDVIGVDMKSDHTLATKVHSYRRADDPQALTQALSEVFAEVSFDGDDTSQESEFELLEGISQEIAAAMLDALTAPGNLPIGSLRKALATENPLTSSMPSARPRPPLGQDNPPQDNDQEGNSWLSLLPIIIGGIIVLQLMRSRTRRRNRR